MRVGDLFSGIGGFSLAAEWMGWKTAWFSEIDPYASAVLAKHWPDVPNLGDITRVDWENVARVDVVTGGFPCQPHSLVGKRAASEDSRDLWSECVRALRELRPDFAVFENVPGLFTSDGGRFFNRVLSDLAALGYDVEWRVLSAADVGAPHKRERVWILVYANSARRGTRQGLQFQRFTERYARLGHSIESRSQGHAGDVAERHESGRVGARPVGPTAAASVRLGAWADTVAVTGHDGTTRLIPREAAEHGPESPLWPVAHGLPGRVARLRAIGNSIVPHCAYEIFQVIAARVAQSNAA